MQVLRKLLMRFLVWRLRFMSDNGFLLLVAGLIGVASGLAAVILKSAVHEIQHLLALGLRSYSVNFLYLGYPIIGILLTVIVSKYFLKERLGHGITDILYAISKKSSIIQRAKTYSRMITSALTVGFGGSVGLEAPIVVTGSAIGSNLARMVHLDYQKRSLLIGCGAAGAIASIFNSPVAGVIFAMEVILVEVTVAQFIPILIASVMGQLLSIMLLGEDILFSFRLTEGFKASDTLFYAGLGIFSGLASLYFTRMMYFMDATIKTVKADLGRALVGGVGLALIILTFPPIYGEGYKSIKQLLQGESLDLLERSFFYEQGNPALVLAFVAAMILMKPVATALTIGAGGSGGIFAPSLFMGGLVGFFYARTWGLLWSASELNESNFTLVGMCGVMSGVLHAPLTAIFLIAEITGGYGLFVPLMLVSAIAFSTIRYFEKHSIYTKSLFERGDLAQDRDDQVLNLIDMKRLIETDLLIVRPEALLDALIDRIKISKRNIFPVVNDSGELEGIVTLDDVREIMFDQQIRETVRVQAIMQKPPAFIDLQEKMQSVMNKFELTRAWNLPVIDEGKYVGFVSKSRIFNAYRTKLKRYTRD